MKASDRIYGSAHKALRRAWAPKVERGECWCCECGRPILNGQRWHLAHDHRGDGEPLPAHAKCNLRERNRRQAWKLRLRRNAAPSRAW
jgi:hypothetical protein